MNDDIMIYLSRFLPFWEALTETEKNYLMKHSTYANFRKNDHIHCGEHDCIGIILVKKGNLRTYMLSDSGKEITLYRLYEGDTCVLSASCVLQTITFDVYIDAATNAEIIEVSASALSYLIQTNLHVDNYVYKLASERFSDVMWAMQQILFMSFDKRLAIFLLDEATKMHSNIITMTHDQIARYIGSAREVVSRMLKYFSEEGIVQLTRGEIKIIDRRKLISLI